MRIQEKGLFSGSYTIEQALDMKKDFSTLSFSEKERICESVFIANGPYWHIYTDGTKMQNIFCCEEDFRTGMWALAASLHLRKEVRALTFELMTNHVHLIIAGQRENCIKAFDLFSTRLKMAFPKRQRTIDWSQFKMALKAQSVLTFLSCQGHP